MDGIRHVTWPYLKAYMVRNWKQGEHVSILGPTGRGKTVLLTALLSLRRHVLLLATKPKDAYLSAFLQTNAYTVAQEYDENENETSRMCIWPAYTQIGDEALQERVFRQTLLQAFSEGNWTIGIDETYYFSATLNLNTSLVSLWTQGRSIGITVVAATQRPKRVPLEMYDQASYLFFFKFNDQNDVERIGDINVSLKKDIMYAVSRLLPYHFLFIDTIRGNTYSTKVEMK